MEALTLYTEAPTEHWEYNTSFISIEDKIVTPRFKHIDFPVRLLQEQF